MLKLLFYRYEINHQLKNCLLTKIIQADTLNTMKIKDFYTPQEYSDITGVALRTVYAGIKRGDIQSLQKTHKCKHLIPAVELPTHIREIKEGGEAQQGR